MVHTGFGAKQGRNGIHLEIGDCHGGQRACGNRVGSYDTADAIDRSDWNDLREELGDERVIIAGDHDRLIQVIINLLSNAVKFCPELDGEVTIRLQPSLNAWRIEVIDNGPGIAPDQHKLIFEKFHQVNDSHAGKPKGTGLGLPISQKIVEHHGGRIWVESAVGQGSTFIVELPGKR